MKKYNYTDVWKQILPGLVSQLKKFPHLVTLPAPPELRAVIGESPNYHFVLQLDYGEVVNKLNSSIATDLAEVFMEEPEVRDFALKMQIVVKLKKNFQLYLSATRD